MFCSTCCIAAVAPGPVGFTAVQEDGTAMLIDLPDRRTTCSPWECPTPDDSNWRSHATFVQLRRGTTITSAATMTTAAPVIPASRDRVDGAASPPQAEVDAAGRAGAESLHPIPLLTNGVGAVAMWDRGANLVVTALHRRLGGIGGAVGSQE